MAIATSPVHLFSNLNWKDFEATTQTAHTAAIPLMEAALAALEAERGALETEIARYNVTEKSPEFLTATKEKVIGLFTRCDTSSFEGIENIVKTSIETYKANTSLFKEDVMKVIRATSTRGGEIFDTLIGNTGEFAAKWGASLVDIVAAKDKYTNIFRACVMQKEALLVKIAADTPKKDETAAVAATSAPGLVARCLTGIGTAAAAPVRLVRWLGGGAAAPDAASDLPIATAAPASSDTGAAAPHSAVATAVAAASSVAAPDAGAPVSVANVSVLV